jgi:inosose dehydratase
MDGAVRLELATGPVSWGVDFAGAPGNPPWLEVVDGIAAAGLRWTELGPLGYLPGDAGDALAARGIGVTAGFVFEPLADRSARERTLAVADAVSTRVAALGGAFLVLIDAVSPERARTAGDADAAERLTPRARAELLTTLGAAAAVAAAHGLRSVVHPHAGSSIEFGDEIEAVAEHFELCLDTGHLAYAGLDPAATYERYAERVPYLHLKDLDPARRRGDFWASVAAGAFRPLGEGAVDLPALLERLGAHCYEGFAVIEQDRRAGGDPVGDLRRGRAYAQEAIACRA